MSLTAALNKILEDILKNKDKPISPSSFNKNFLWWEQRRYRYFENERFILNDLEQDYENQRRRKYEEE